MGFEIEHKFLVVSDAWRSSVDDSVRMRQGYFRTAPESTVRVRLVSPVDGDEADRRGELTIKGPPSEGVRPEFEYTISPDDVERMLELFCADRVVEKTRHFVDHRGDRWVVDVFAGDNDGLVLAELELETTEQDFAVPEWAGREVTDEASYTNAALAREPMAERARSAEDG